MISIGTSSLSTIYLRVLGIYKVSHFVHHLIHHLSSTLSAKPPAWTRVQPEVRDMSLTYHTLRLRPMNSQASAHLDADWIGAVCGSPSKHPALPT